MAAEAAAADLPASPGPAAGGGDPARSTDNTRQIRGSSLLLAGRGLSLLMNLLTQVIAIRYLSKAGFGAFAFGLALSSIGETLTSPAHNQVLGRFLARYDEEGEPEKVVGTIVLQLVGALGLGIGVIAAVWAAREALTGSLDAPEATAVVIVLVVLAPLEGIDDVFEALFAVFARPRAIFVRKHLLAPGLRLGAVGLLVAVGGGALFLATAYVVAVALGLVAYGVVLVPLLRERGLLQYVRNRRFSLPVRAVAAATAPMLTVELVFHAVSNIALVVLGLRRGAEEVAALRAVFPAARLNSLVAASFTLLFVPLASRLWARGERQELRDAYWRTAAWMAVLGLPVLVATTALAPITTVLLFGERYEGSAPAMALLSAGYYVSGALGMSLVVLQAVGRLRAMAAWSLAVGVTGIGAVVLVAPRFGATGVALVGAVTLAVQAVASQVVASRVLGMAVLDGRYRRVYLTVLASVVVVAAFVAVVDPEPVLAVVLAVVVSALALRAVRSHLDVERTFPELARLPLVGPLLRTGGTSGPGAGERPAVRVARSRPFSAGLAVLEAVPARRPSLAVVTYHRIAPRGADPFYPGLVSASPDELDEQLAWLARDHHPISGDELLAIRRGEAILPRRAVLVTFDDGYRDLAEHAWPLLRRHGVPAVVFVATGYVDDRSRLFWWDRLHAALATTDCPSVREPGGEVLPLGTPSLAAAAFRRLRPRLKALPADELAAAVAELVDELAVAPPPAPVLGWDELRRLAGEGLMVAPHSVNHPLLTRVSAEEVRAELAASSARLHDELGSCPPVFAYPSGAHDPAVVAEVRAAGFEIAVTTRRGVNDLRVADWLRLRRINVGSFGTPGLRGQLAPALSYLRRWSGPPDV